MQTSQRSLAATDCTAEHFLVPVSSYAVAFCECSDCAVLSSSVTVCRGPHAAMSRCCSVPSSSRVDVQQVQGRRWAFAKLSLLSWSKSVWADGQTEESVASPAPTGSATFSLVQSSTGQIILSLLKAFRKNWGRMTHGWTRTAFHQRYRMSVLFFFSYKWPECYLKHPNWI